MSEIHKPGFWAVLPAAVRYDEQIAPNAKLLYAEISSLTDAEGYCDAEDEYFTRVFGFSARSVSRLLGALDAAGYIRIEKQRGEHNAVTARRIFAGLNPLQGADPVLPKLAKQCESGCENAEAVLPKLSGSSAKIVQTHIIKKPDIYTPHKPPKGGASAKRELKKAPEWKPERFARLRAYYPKGYAKDLQREIRAWDKLRLSDQEIDDMAKGLQRMKTDPEWVRGIGIPHLSTFLNGQRWRDADSYGEAGVSIPDTAAPREELPLW